MTEDPRTNEIFEHRRQTIMRKIERLQTNKETSEDTRKQAIDEREAQVSSKRKNRQQENGPEPESKRQVVPREPIKDGFEEYATLQRPLEAVKPHAPSGADINRMDTPHPVCPPGSNKGLPSLYQCAEQLKRRVHFIFHLDSLYAFNGKCYDHLYPDDIIRLYREKVDNQLGGEKGLGSISQLHKFLSIDSSLQVGEIESNQRVAVLQNGVFDVMTGELREHNYKEVTFSYIKAKYLDKAKCKIFHQFLRAITHGDEVLQERLWQFLGYMLLQTDEAKAFFIMGTAPDSGKSVLGNFIESLFDSRYVSNIALNDLNKHFSLAPLAGSAINISLDLPATKLKPSAVSLLKMITGGDTIEIEQKYMAKFNYRNRAKLLFASNFPIELYENDDAFWKRMVYLPFDYSISKSNQNTDLLKMLQEERDAVVSEALRHAKTLIENNFCFPSTYMIERRMQEWQGRVNPSIESFLHDCCIVDEGCRGELTKTLFSAYQRYCDSSSLVANSWSFFKQFLENEVGLKHFKMRNGGDNPQSAFRGIKLKEGYL